MEDRGLDAVEIEPLAQHAMMPQVVQTGFARFPNRHLSLALATQTARTCHQRSELSKMEKAQILASAAIRFRA